MNYPDDIGRFVECTLSPHYSHPERCVCAHYEACKYCLNYCEYCTKKDDEGFCPSCNIT